MATRKIESVWHKASAASVKEVATPMIGELGVSVCVLFYFFDSHMRTSKHVYKVEFSWLSLLLARKSLTVALVKELIAVSIPTAGHGFCVARRRNRQAVS